MNDFLDGRIYNNWMDVYNITSRNGDDCSISRWKVMMKNLNEYKPGQYLYLSEFLEALARSSVLEDIDNSIIKAYQRNLEERDRITNAGHFEGSKECRARDAAIEDLMSVVECRLSRTGKEEYIRRNYKELTGWLGSNTTMFAIDRSCREMLANGHHASAGRYSAMLANGEIEVSNPMAVFEFYRNIFLSMATLRHNSHNLKSRNWEWTQISDTIYNSTRVFSGFVEALSKKYEALMPDVPFWALSRKANIEQTMTHLGMRLGGDFADSNMKEFLEHCIEVSETHIAKNPWLKLLEPATIDILASANQYSTGPGGWTIDTSLPDNYILSIIDRSDVLKAYTHSHFPNVRNGVELIRALAFPTQQAIVAQYIDSFVSDKMQYAPLSAQLELR